MKHVLFHIKGKRGRSPSKTTRLEISPNEAAALAKKKLIRVSGHVPGEQHYLTNSPLPDIQKVRKAAAALA